MEVDQADYGQDGAIYPHPISSFPPGTTRDQKRLYRGRRLRTDSTYDCLCTVIHQ